MKKILGIGNALVDRLTRVENDRILNDLDLAKGAMQLIDAARYRSLQKTLDTLPCKRTTGGSACNTIQAVAHLGGQAGLIGKVGNDAEGRFFADHFGQLGVHTRLLNSDLPTGVASTFITPDGQRTFGTYLGAAATLQAEELRPAWFAGYDYLYIEGYLVQNHALIAQCVSLAHEAGLQVCLDLASYNIVAADRDFFATLLPQTDVVLANEAEAEAYTGVADPQANLDALAACCDTAVVKVGKAGVLVKHGGTTLHCPARDVPRVVDTTAAGDYFAAGFLQGMALGRDLQACARLGSLLAGHIIETVGTALSPDTWQLITAQERL